MREVAFLQEALHGYPGNLAVKCGNASSQDREDLEQQTASTAGLEVTAADVR